MRRFSLLLLLIFLVLQSCTTQKSAVQSQQSTTVIAEAPVDTVIYDKASPFADGFARVEKDSSSFYINAKGARSFDYIISSFQPLDSVVAQGNGYVSLFKNEDKLMRIVTRNDHYGLVNEAGQWVFKPSYDSLSFKFKRYVEIRKDGKMTYADSWGKLLVPLKFEDVGILDGTYYDVKKNGKWGIYDASNNNMIIPFEYEKFDYCGGCGSGSDYVYARKNGKWGVLDFNNKVLVPFEYEHEHFNMRSGDWVTAFQKKGESVVINIPQQKEYGPPEYTSPQMINGVLVAKKKGKYGMINAKGKKLNDFVYDDMWDAYGTFKSGPYLVIEKDGNYGVIDTLGNTVIPPQYAEQVFPHGNYFQFTKNDKEGLLNAQNEIVLSAEYDQIHEEEITLSDGSHHQFFELFKNKKYGFFIPKTSTIVQPTFDKITPYNYDKQRDTYEPGFPPGLIAVEKNDKTGFYSTDGTPILPPQFYGVDFITDTNITARKDPDGGEGFYDIQKEKTIILFTYEYLEPLSGDQKLIQAEKAIGDYDSNYGVFDHEGKEILPVEYSYIKALDEQHFLLNKKDSLYYVWNAKSRKKEQLPFEKVIKNDSTALLTVRKNSKVFLYDYQKKKVLLKKGFADISQLKNGFFVVVQKDSAHHYTFGYANPKGKLIVPIKYDTKPDEYLTYFNNKYYLPLYKSNPDQSSFITNDYQGFADFKGNILVQPKYQKVLPELNGHGFLTENNNHFGVIDARGNEILPAKYNIVLNQALSPYKDTAEFNFPLLFGNDDHWQYIREDGKILPVKAHGYFNFTKRRRY